VDLARFTPPGWVRLAAGGFALVTVAGLTALAAVPASAGSTGTASSYLVTYKQGASTKNAASAVKAAGGTLVASYSQIGVVVARSDQSDFATKVRSASGVEGAASTNGFAMAAPATDTTDATLDVPVDSSSEPLAPLQWDMAQIRAFQAHAVTGGSSDVVVGDLDTGLDFTHPDIAPNYDAANSADCSSGTPQPLLVGNDQNGHGTHTAGTIAAAVNGIGITGVAPNVKIAGIKSSNDDGFFFPEMVVCAFMWAATHGIDVTNNSYFADPWLFNCKNDAGQRAIWNAERRAIQYAISKGTTVVASAGNENQDLSKTNTDTISPDFPPGGEVERTVTNACSVVPVEVPGVIGVSANGNTGDKSFYSNYGVGAISVVAPGGDSLHFNQSPTVPNGRVLSSWPSYIPCSRKVVDQGATYCYLQGTSMAGPHVVGVAALIRSQHPNLSPSGVAALLDSTAVPQACPTNPYDPTGDGAFLAICVGGSGYNGFYGHGEADALNAVS
jgi:subtilisin family serine protease